MNSYKNECVDQIENDYESFDDFEAYENYEEADFHHYKDSTYDLISKVAYLLRPSIRLEHVSETRVFVSMRSLQSLKARRLTSFLGARITLNLSHVRSLPQR